MTPQRFRSSSVREALAQARQTLGPSALVLGTRLVPASGWRGWLGGREVEVSAFASPAVSENRRSSTFEASQPAGEVAEAKRPVTDSLVARLIATGLDRDLAEAVVDEVPGEQRRDVTQGQLRQALATCVAPVASRSSEPTIAKISVEAPRPARAATGAPDAVLTVPSDAGSHPSRAIANPIRAVVSSMLFSVPKADTANATSSTVVASLPRNAWAARAPTDGASGYATELAVATASNGSTRK